MNSPTPNFDRPSARWVILATWMLVLGPIVALEWEREPARWIAAAALELAQNRDFEGARAKLNEAIARYPESESSILQRIRLDLDWARQVRPWRRAPDEPAPSPEQRQALLQEALADIRGLIEKNPHVIYIQLCSDVLLELGDGQGAVDEVQRLVENPQGLRHSTLLNMHAYARACANVELPEALKQIDEALGYHPVPSPTRTMYLDTRGFIHFLLGDFDKALADMNEAIEAHRKQEFDLWDKGKAAKQANDMRRIDYLDLQIRESMAVLLYHRYLTLDGMGDVIGANADFEEIESLLPGYDGEELR